jgi:hypothetical protein
MNILRQYIAPLLVTLVFFLALIAVSARIFLPDDMAAPAPVSAADSVGMVSPAIAPMVSHGSGLR